MALVQQGSFTATVTFTLSLANAIAVEPPPAYEKAVIEWPPARTLRRPEAVK